MSTVGKLRPAVQFGLTTANYHFDNSRQLITVNSFLHTHEEK